MLKDNLYRFENIADEGNTITADIFLDLHHPIFKGHYPNQPVLPGACMLQMVKDLLEVLELPLMLVSSTQMKFLAMVIPAENQQLFLTLTYKKDDGNIGVNASLASGSTTHFKFQGKFKQA